MSEQLQDGFALMALGLGTVFGFLVLLIFSITVMSFLIGRFSRPEAAVTSNTGRRRNGIQMEQIAAVAAAARAAQNR